MYGTRPLPDTHPVVGHRHGQSCDRLLPQHRSAQVLHWRPEHQPATARSPLPALKSAQPVASDHAVRSAADCVANCQPPPGPRVAGYHPLGGRGDRWSTHTVPFCTITRMPDPWHCFRAPAASSTSSCSCIAGEQSAADLLCLVERLTSSTCAAQRRPPCSPSGAPCASLVWRLRFGWALVC
jgi:hypothetical protein